MNNLPAQSGVYQIRNTVTGERYIGASVNIKTRCRNHERAIKCGWYLPKALRAAVATYGKDCFRFEALILCERKMLAFYERQAIKVLKPAYNVRAVRDVDHNSKRGGKSRG